MPRPPRTDAPGTWHHVMNRGARRQLVFDCDRDRAHFVSLLGDLDAEFGLEVHLFCLMGNHFHLVVRSRNGQLSAAMKCLSEMFTMASNIRHGRDGAIFRGRFHNVIVDDDRHHRWLFHYVHANPTAAGWRAPLDRYPWSSLGAYLGSARPPSWLHRSAYSEAFENDPCRMKRFAEQSDLPTPAITERPLARFERMLAAPVPMDSDSPATCRPDPVALVCHIWESGEVDVRQGSRGNRNDVRLAFALLAMDHAGWKPEQAAVTLGLASANSARNLLSRARRLQSTDTHFAARISRAISAFER